MPMEQVPEEGPEQQIRNALQIVRGLSYMFETRDGPPGWYSPDAWQLVRESAEGLERRLSVALAQLPREDTSMSWFNRVPDGLPWSG